MDACEISQWLVPPVLNADQAGELALAARAESKACNQRHEALIECVNKHNKDLE